MTLLRRSLAAFALALACTACSKGTNGGTSPPPAAPVWIRSYEASLFARALDVSCAPPDALTGVEGCIALVRFNGALKDHPGVKDSAVQYGDIWFERFDAAGKVIWARSLVSGLAPDYGLWGGLIDDDARVRLLATGEFLFSGTYFGRVLFGQGDKSQELGTNVAGDEHRRPFLIEFHADGTFDNWADTGNDRDLYCHGAGELSNTDLVLAGSCQGDVPLDSGSFPCGDQVHGYVLPTHYDGSTRGDGLLFGGEHPAEAADVVAGAAAGLFVSGSFEEKMQFSGEPADAVVLGAGANDGFLAAFDASLKRSWIVLAGGLGQDRGGRLARIPGGVLWTARVSPGARVGRTQFAIGGQVVAKVDDSGAVLWARAVPGADDSQALGVAAADDGSFALYGDGFLGRYSADGVLQWERTDVEVRGAAFTKTQVVVAGTVLGTRAFDQPIAASGSDVLRAVLAAFAR